MKLLTSIAITLAAAVAASCSAQFNPRDEVLRIYAEGACELKEKSQQLEEEDALLDLMGEVSRKEKKAVEIAGVQKEASELIGSGMSWLRAFKEYNDSRGGCSVDGGSVGFLLKDRYGNPL